MRKANTALVPQLLSLEAKQEAIEKENESLRFLLKEKEQSEKDRQNETRRKTQDKLSLSMIKDQHNEALNALRATMEYEMQSKLQAQEQILLAHKAKIAALEDKASRM